MHTSSAADRHLLFGILALQLDFINREQLVTAMHAWALDKQRSLGDILSAQNALAADNRSLLDALVEKHLVLHGNDPHKCLAAVGANRAVPEDFKAIADADVQATASFLPSKPPADPFATRDPYATAPPDSQSSASLERGAMPTRRYQKVRPHAKGGLGEVFVAEDSELHREIALKEIQTQHADDIGSRDRFVLEAEITGGLEHPGIVPVYGLGAYADGRPFYAMRFIRGDNLKDAIAHFHNKPHPVAGAVKDPRPTNARVAFDSLEFRQLLGRFLGVCNAIAYAHSRGVVHRDLKPGNVMLGKFGETLVVDWGLAKVVGSTESGPSGEATLRPASGSGIAETVAGNAIGTPVYMSPEQAAGNVDQIGPASDVYGLGATLFSMLTDRAPVRGDNLVDVLHKVQGGDVGFNAATQDKPLPTGLPRPLIAICQKAMALRPRTVMPRP